MYDVVSSAVYKARKPHRCTWCGQQIPVGLEYRNERVRGPDGLCFNKLHHECDEALRAAAREEGGWVEFTPYDNERPALQVGKTVKAP